MYNPLYIGFCWTIFSQIKKTLESTKTWLYQWMLRISWIEGVIKEEISKIIGTRKMLLTIRERHLKFLKHIMKKIGKEHLTYTGIDKEIEAKKWVTWLKILTKWMLEQGTHRRRWLGKKQDFVTATKHRKLSKVTFARDHTIWSKQNYNIYQFDI